MHVRLGFAVAAYLEPDILVVDEVLAVGDAEFQKKCIVKIMECSKRHNREKSERVNRCCFWVLFEK